MIVSKNTAAAIRNTWGAFEGEAAEMCDGSNEIAMEFVLDANRMRTAGHADAEAEVETLIDKHGFGDVRRTLAREIELLY